MEDDTTYHHTESRCNAIFGARFAVLYNSKFPFSITTTLLNQTLRNTKNCHRIIHLNINLTTVRWILLESFYGRQRKAIGITNTPIRHRC